MKKLLALLMAAGMTLSSSVFAIDITGVPENVDVNVATSVKMKKSANDDWTTSPINIYASAEKSFDFQTKLDMSEVREAYEKLYANTVELAAEKGFNSATAILNELPVTGSFEVNIEYPAEVKLPDTITADSKTMEGFAYESGTGSVTDVYTETGRTVSGNVLTIAVNVKDGVKISDLLTKDGEKVVANDKLGDLVLTCENVEITSSDVKAYTITGNVTGSTSATFNGESTKKVTVNYAFGDIEATVNIVEPSNGGSGGSSSKTVTVKFDVGTTEAKIESVSSKNKVEINFDTIVVPTVEGKEFDGFYADAAFTQPLTGKKTFTVNTTVYAKWVDAGTEPVDPDKPTDPDAPIFTDNHIAYIIGYPEGTVKPEDNISREEVATVFYRLLRAEKQIEIAATENRFSDVDESRWSNKAISSMAKGGYISGYESGTFKPEQFITRAEFVTIIANMYKFDKTPATAFSDVTNGYWASGYIGAVSAKGWVNGYEDGTFKPEQFITRAEVMATVNRMLDRKVSADGISADAKIWSDVKANDWFYLDVIEATNAHEYTTEDGAEIWTKVVDNNVWAEKPTFEDAE